MTINYVDISLAAVFILSAVFGYCRGIIINVVNFIRYSIGISLCFYLSSNGTMPLYDGFVKQIVLERINRQIVTSDNVDTVIGNLNNVIKSLPQFIAKAIDITTIDITSKDLANTILNNVFEPIILVLLKIAIFIIVFIVFFGATGIIIHIVKKSSKRKEEKNGKKSVIKKADKFFGLVLGVLVGAVLVFALSSVYMFVLSNNSNISDAQQFLNQIENSVCLKYINEINPFNAITEGLI